MADAKPKKSILKKGIIVFLVGFFLNMAFMLLGIGGLLRELSRLSVIVGFVMIVVGLLLKLSKK